MTIITATLDDSRRVFFDPQHNTDSERVQALIDAYHAAGDNWIFPAVLVVESEGNGDTVIDGHHRLTAAKRLGLQGIPTWVISVPDYCRVCEDHFDGSSPVRLMDLWEHVSCDGTLYADLQG